MVVLGVVIMAIFMFWGAEKLEGIFGDKSASWRRRRRGRLAGGRGRVDGRGRGSAAGGSTDHGRQVAAHRRDARRNWPTVPCRLRPRSCWSTSTTTRSSSR
ncbi:MAG: hypothetical protein R3A10_06830 [Caldilineaceae bacterium]